MGAWPTYKGVWRSASGEIPHQMPQLVSSDQAVDKRSGQVCAIVNAHALCVCKVCERVVGDAITVGDVNVCGIAEHLDVRVGDVLPRCDVILLAFKVYSVYRVANMG